MSTHPTSTRSAKGSVALAALALGAVALLTACSATQAETSSTSAASVADPTMAPVQAAADLVPAAIRDAGVLKVAIPTNEPPTQFYREGTKEMTGVNPDIARLVAGALGLKLQIEVTNFDAIIPGLSAGRYDMTVSSMTPTEERMKQLDFVEYVQFGSALGVPAGNPSKISFDALCGKKVAVLKGSYQLTVNVPDLQVACTDAGDDAIEILQFQDTQQAITAVLSSRADVVYADSPILGYAATQEARFEVGAENDFAPVAIGIPHDTGMLEAVTAAMTAVLASTEYQDVLAAYGLETMAITEARVNVPQG